MTEGFFSSILSRTHLKAFILEQGASLPIEIERTHEAVKQIQGFRQNVMRNKALFAHNWCITMNYSIRCTLLVPYPEADGRKSIWMQPTATNVRFTENAIHKKDSAVSSIEALLIPVECLEVDERKKLEPGAGNAGSDACCICYCSIY